MGQMTAGARYVYHHDVFVRLSIFLLSQLLLNFLLLLVDNIVCSFGEVSGAGLSTEGLDLFLACSGSPPSGSILFWMDWVFFHSTH